MAVFSRSPVFNLRSRKVIWTGWIVFCLGLMVGCTTQNMYNQPRYDPLEPSEFFADGQSARQLVPGTVARGQLRDDQLLYEGRSGGEQSSGEQQGGGEQEGGQQEGGGAQGGGQAADTFPFPVTREVLVRGQTRYNTFCVPCHGLAGYGDGMIVQRGFSPPPAFHSDRLRNAPVGHYFDVITNGFGRMPEYGPQIPTDDRWAIIAYIRALQLSQNATLEDVPPEQRQELQETQP